MKKGYSPRVSLMWVALLCTMSAAGGTLALVLRQAEYAAAAIACVIAVMIVSRIFGVAEYELIMSRAYGFARSLFRISRNGSNLTEPQLQSSVHVQGNRQWDVTWKRFCEFSNQHQLNKLTLDVNAPWLHESFHATVRSREKIKEASDIWKSIVPLLVDGRVFGSVEIRCSKDSAFTHHEIILALMSLTTDLEQEIIQPVDSNAAPEVEFPVHQ